MTDLQIVAFVLLWIVISAEGVLLFVLYRHVALRETNIKAGLPVGTRAPNFSATNLNHESLKLADLLGQHINLLVFGSLGCQPCHTLLIDEGVNHFLISQRVQSAFLFAGAEEMPKDLQEMASQSRTAFHVMLTKQNVFKDFQISATPYMYLLDKAGMILSRAPVGKPDDLIQLYTQVTAADHTEEVLPLSTTAISENAGSRK